MNRYSLFALDGHQHRPRDELSGLSGASVVFGVSSSSPLIPRVLDDLTALGPDVVVPAHFTGWRAQHAMASRFGDAFIPNTVGTRFELCTGRRIAAEDGCSTTPSTSLAALDRPARVARILGTLA